MVSITDFFHMIQFQKMKIPLLISQDWNLILQCKQPWTSWLKKMSGGYLVRKSWRWLLGSRLFWPPRPSEGGDHLLRHSLDPSLLSSTLIVDKNNRKTKNTFWQIQNLSLDRSTLSFNDDSFFCFWNVKRWCFKIFALASFFLLLNFVKLGILHSRLSWAVTQWLLCPIWKTRRRRGCELELNKFEVHGCDLFPHDDLTQKYNAIICSDTPTMWLWRNWTCVH